ncbi:MAG: Rrf2 family transcriptional regulator [Coriobacteriales bacterium]|nr:Rrf2 family transcriptional regulator [Coriobacteriales bacterium]
MDISRKTDYALRMISELVQEPDAIVSVRSAAEDNGVPYSFARSIQHELVRAGIITSLRGSRGGMRLAVDPNEVSLLDVIEAVQGPISLAQCDNPACSTLCPNKPKCHLNPIWRGARELLSDYFSKISLADAVQGVDVAAMKGQTPLCSSGVARLSAELASGACDDEVPDAAADQDADGAGSADRSSGPSGSDISGDSRNPQA